MGGPGSGRKPSGGRTGGKQSKSMKSYKNVRKAFVGAGGGPKVNRTGAREMAKVARRRAAGG